MNKGNAQVHILVLDDDEAVQQSLVAFLEDYGFAVSFADCAETALALLEKIRCDIAIVDIRLPGMSGDRFIQKAQERWPHMQYLIYTGSAQFSASDERNYIELPQDQVLTKPIEDMILIVRAIERLMKQV